MGEKTRLLLFILSVAFFTVGSGASKAVEKNAVGSAVGSKFSGKFKDQTTSEALAILGSRLGIRITVVGSTAGERVSSNLVDCTLDECIARILRSENYIVSRPSPSVVEIFILNGSEYVSNEARSRAQTGLPAANQPEGEARYRCIDFESGCGTHVVAPDPTVPTFGFQADDVDLWPPSTTSK